VLKTNKNNIDKYLFLFFEEGFNQILKLFETNFSIFV